VITNRLCIDPEVGACAFPLLVAAAASHSGVELGAALVGEGEGVSQQLDGVAVEGAADPTFERADRPGD